MGPRVHVEFFKISTLDIVFEMRPLDMRVLFSQGDPSKPENVQKFYDDNVAPLVGQMTNQNDEKRYKKRPLVMVFYGVDFSFEHREGKRAAMR